MRKARCRAERQQVSAHFASTACRHMVSGAISLPLLGCFSPFPHGTSTLSVAGKYLALESGLPRFRRGFTCPVLLRNRLGIFAFSSTGLSPSMVRLSIAIRLTLFSHVACPTTPDPQRDPVWAIPVSLATTQGISIDFYSSGY